MSQAYQDYCNANYGPEDIPTPYEICGTCMGSGYSNHPDSGEICQSCGGQGAVECPAPAVSNGDRGTAA